MSHERKSLLLAGSLNIGIGMLFCINPLLAVLFGGPMIIGGIHYVAKAMIKQQLMLSIV